MKRFRFSVLGLFLLISAVALFLGYSQWRRRNILQQVEEIELLGGDVPLPNGYFDYLWQRLPDEGFILLQFSDETREKKVEAVKEKMRELGINRVKEFYSF
jgi:hypothetical protein